MLLSLSSMSSPDTSTVTLCSVPVNRKGEEYSGSPASRDWRRR
jgi:hypothetical protein